IQSIYIGKSKCSCPNESAEHFKDTAAANFQFEYSDTKTYWSTQETMHTLVDTIIAPYFDQKKEELGLSPNQKAIWQIDVWLVHHSKEFCSWLRENHPNIILIYVPGGCTGVFQACNIGIQHIFKLLLKRSYHGNVVAEILQQLDKKVKTVVLAKTVEVMRDCSVTWLWKAYEAINKKEIVQKASNLYLSSAFVLTS
ncbi:hypothetical protein BT96DRAFT_821561, partial [Gymnopus androsaceus JB14]